MSVVYINRDLDKAGVSFKKKFEQVMKEVERGTFTLEEFFNRKESCYYLLTVTGGYRQRWEELEEVLKEFGVSEGLIERLHKWYRSFNELISLVERLVYDEILGMLGSNLSVDRQRLVLIPSFAVPVAGISVSNGLLIYYNPVVIEEVIERDRRVAREYYTKVKTDEKKWNSVVEQIQRVSTSSVELSLNVEQGFPFIVLHELLHYGLGHFRVPSTDYLWEEFRNRYGEGVKEAIMNVIYDLEINSYYLMGITLSSESYYRALGVEEIRDTVSGKQVVVKCKGIVPKAEVVEEVVGANLVRAGVGEFKKLHPNQPALSIIREEDLSFLVQQDLLQYYFDFDFKAVEERGRKQEKEGKGGVDGGNEGGLDEWLKREFKEGLRGGAQEWKEGWGRSEEPEKDDLEDSKELLEKFGELVDDLVDKLRSKSKTKEARDMERKKEDLDKALKEVSDLLERISEKRIGSGKGEDFEMDKEDIYRAKRVKFADSIKRALSNIIMSVEDLVGKESGEYKNKWDKDSLARYVSLRERFRRDNIDAAAAFLRREPVRLKQKRIFVAIDTSGSMGQDEEVCALSIAKSIIDRMVRRGLVESVDVGFLGDSDISVLEKVRGVRELERRLAGFKMDRYGGTNMAKIFEYLVEKDLLRNYSAVVIATDGETPWDAPEKVKRAVQGMGVKVAVCVVSDRYEKPQDYINKNSDVKHWIKNGQVFVLNKKSMMKEIDSGLSP